MGPRTTMGHGGGWLAGFGPGSPRADGTLTCVPDVTDSARVAAPALVGLLAAGCAHASAGQPVTTKESVWLGSRVGADALANTRIGGPFGTTLAFRFRSTWSGSVTGVRFYVVVNSGSVGEYSGGDGGILRVSLVAHGKNGRPTAKTLAELRAAPANPHDQLSLRPLRYTAEGHSRALLRHRLHEHQPAPERELGVGQRPRR